MIKALLKRDIKLTYKLFIVTNLIMVLLLIALLFATKGLSEVSAKMIINQYFSLFATLIPYFYISSCANRLTVQQIERGHFAYTMAAPLKRNQVTSVSAIYLMVSILVSHILYLLVGIIFINVFGTNFPISSYALITLGCFLLTLAVSGFSFLSSVFFSTNATATAVGLGIPLAFFLLHFVGDMFAGNKLLKLCKYLSLNSLFDIEKITQSDPIMLLYFGILLVMGILLYIASFITFNKRDLFI